MHVIIRSQTTTYYLLLPLYKMLTKTVYMCVSNCVNITSASVPTILNGLPCLQRLYLAGCTGIAHNATATADVRRPCPALESLVLGGGCAPPDDLLAAVLERCLNLRTLYLSGCAWLTDAALESLCHGAHLQLLDLAGAGHQSIHQLLLLLLLLVYMYNMNMCICFYVTCMAIDSD